MRGIRKILPWQRLGAKETTTVERREDRFQLGSPPNYTRARVDFSTPLDVSARNPRDNPAAIFVRALYRIDGLGRWCGTALENRPLKSIEDMVHEADYRWLETSPGLNKSPNRKAEARHDAVMSGSLEISEIPKELGILLQLAERAGIGRKTNEGLGQIRVTPL